MLVKHVITDNITKNVKIRRVSVRKTEPTTPIPQVTVIQPVESPPPPPRWKHLPTASEFDVYRLGEVFTGRRVMITNIGLDIGTKTVVIAYRNDDKVNYIAEINGYWVFQRRNKFIESLLNDPNKIRSDGTKRPARWIPLDDKAIVLGKDAEEMAYAQNDTMRRPMAEGSISADEEAMTVLASIVQGLIETAETEIGKFDKNVSICYCTTAPAINKPINMDYHERVVNMIVDGYETKSHIKRSAIRESHAIVLDMDEGDGTGIGISWGAGTVTVSYVKSGLEIYSFCYVGAGDWIDEQVAIRHGYDPNSRKRSAETPTTVSKRKTEIDLTPGLEQNSRIDLDLTLHYDVLINKVITGIVAGFRDNEANARIDGAINVYMAGGTSSPNGFVERVSARFAEHDLPFEIGSLKRSDKPLYCVASGCLKAAEYGITD